MNLSAEQHHTLSTDEDGVLIPRDDVLQRLSGIEYWSHAIDGLAVCDYSGGVTLVDEGCRGGEQQAQVLHGGSSSTRRESCVGAAGGDPLVKVSNGLVGIPSQAMEAWR